MKNILNYLHYTYDPTALILYGSYRDGSNGAGSDFDCLVISSKSGCRHDTSTVDGVVLDAFIYSPEEVSGEIDCNDFLQIHDGSILLDTDGIAEALLCKVRQHLHDLPRKASEEIHNHLAWCDKMLARTQRGDTEGYFRWHWLLHDSLEIYCDICGKHYFGPKKSLRFMAENDPTGYKLYSDALACLDYDHLSAWIWYLQKLAHE